MKEGGDGTGKVAGNGPIRALGLGTQTGEDWFLHFQDKGALGRSASATHEMDERLAGDRD